MLKMLGLEFQKCTSPQKTDHMEPEHGTGSLFGFQGNTSRSYQSLGFHVCCWWTSRGSSVAAGNGSVREALDDTEEQESRPEMCNDSGPGPIQPWGIACHFSPGFLAYKEDRNRGNPPKNVAPKH